MNEKSKLKNLKKRQKELSEELEGLKKQIAEFEREESRTREYGSLTVIYETRDRKLIYSHPVVEGFEMCEDTTPPYMYEDEIGRLRTFSDARPPLMSFSYRPITTVDGGHSQLFDARKEFK